MPECFLSGLFVSLNYESQWHFKTTQMIPEKKPKLKNTTSFSLKCRAIFLLCFYRVDDDFTQSCLSFLSITDFDRTC